MLLKVERKINLVYGGGSIGLMGTISKTVFQGGCHVLGYAFSLIIVDYLTKGLLKETK